MANSTRKQKQENAFPADTIRKSRDQSPLGHLQRPPPYQRPGPPYRPVDASSVTDVRPPSTALIGRRARLERDQVAIDEPRNKGSDLLTQRDRWH